MSVLDSDCELFTHVISTPIGDLTLAVLKRGGIVAVRFGKCAEWPGARRVEANKYACGELAFELGEYFAGKRQHFSLPLVLEGSDFQKNVWHSLQKVPYGTVVSYSELARRAGCRSAVRAVATAVGLNPVPILIPCHRVIMQSGAGGNYARRWMDDDAGRQMKRRLLELEGVVLKGNARR
jgi:methylated-DNA-[protein]-cysteine S-methyltransferase